MGLRRFFTRRRAEHDLDDEIRFDLAEESRRLVELGASPDAAHDSARRSFGSVIRIKEETREAWGWAATERLFQDVRFACRTVRTNAGYSLAAVLTLAVGLGLCSFLFNTLDALLLRPLPGAREPARLVATQSPVAFAYFENYGDLSDVAAAVAAYIGPVPFNVTQENEETGSAERISGHLVSLDYFSTLGVRPLLGRFFDRNLDSRGSSPTAIVSERFWRTRLNGDANAIGRDIWINRQRATVIGVTERDFQGLFPIMPADIFVPVTANPIVAPELAGGALENPDSRAFRVVLRLAPGVGMKAVAAALDTKTRQLDDAFGQSWPNQDSEPRARLISAGTLAPYPAEVRSGVVVFFSVMTVLILTFTCANIAGLALARTSARRQEISLRLALGAGRTRVVRQLLTESILLAVAGGAGGLAATYVFTELLTRVVASSPLFRLAAQLTPDSRVAALTFLVSVATGVALGLVPALAVTRSDLINGLKGHLGASLARYRRFGLRNLFMVYQVTAAMALVVIMGFMLFGIQSGASRDAGFAAEGLSMFSLDPVRDGHSVDEGTAVLAGLPDRLIEAGGVEAAALLDSQPFQQFALPTTTASIPGGGAPETETIQRVAVQTVGPGFFATLGVPVQRGVEFSHQDFQSMPASGAAIQAVINHTAAELFGVDPLGKIFRLEDRVLQVAGIVKYGLPPPFGMASSPTVFLPLTVQDLQRPRPQGIPVLVRTLEGDGLEHARRVLKRIDASLTMFNARTVHDQIDDLYMVVRYTQAVYAVVGLFALVLASVGLAGVTAHAAMSRRKEIGIRMALGARSLQVLGLVMREGAIMTAAGACIGIAFAFGLARMLMAINSQLGQAILLGTGNPIRLLAGPAILIAVTALACYLPARSSAHVNPLVALREE